MTKKLIKLNQVLDEDKEYNLDPTREKKEFLLSFTAPTTGHAYGSIYVEAFNYDEAKCIAEDLDTTDIDWYDVDRGQIDYDSVSLDDIEEQ